MQATIQYSKSENSLILISMFHYIFKINRDEDYLIFEEIIYQYNNEMDDNKNIKIKKEEKKEDFSTIYDEEERDEKFIVQQIISD